MKLLIVLSLTQIAAIVVLYSKLTDIDQRMDSATSVAQPATVSDATTYALSPTVSNDAHHYPDEDRWRQIIREELGARLDGADRVETYADQYVAPDSTDYAELEYRREFVSQQLDYFTSVGSISPTDMQKLQSDIAKLDAAGRREMLGKLTQALNSGRLEGSL